MKLTHINGIQFPILLQAKERDGIIVVLFTEERTGTIVQTHPSSIYKLGWYDNTWNMGKFSIFNGEVVLFNPR